MAKAKLPLAKTRGVSESVSVPVQLVEPAGEASSLSAAPWWFAFCFLGILAIAFTWFPISRINAHYELNYNEGWNVYPQQVAASGGKIYGQAPVHEYWNYPPVSFHVVGLLGNVMHDYNLAGRWIALLSFLALATLTALSVQRLTGSWRSGVFSALWVAVFIGALKSERIAMNDPHQLGMALIAFGFYAYLRADDSPLWLRISAVAFVLGLFTKHSLLAFPLAVAVHLALTSRKRLVDWIIAGAASGAVLLGLTFALDGPHLFQHLALPRIYSYAFFVTNTVWFLLIFQTAILVSLAWCFQARLRDSQGVLVFSCAFSIALGFWFSAGGGADLNHLFDSLVAMAMIGGAALPYAVAASRRVRYSGALLAVLLTLPLSLGALTMLAPHIQEDLQNSHSIPQAEQEFAAAVQFLKAHPGPAICEQMVMCFEAGKPEEYDPYEMDQQMRTGKLADADVLQLIGARHFTAIQLLNDANHPVAPVERPGFSQAFMTRLLDNYRPAMQASSFVILVPK
jgi:hypothetical protein